MVSRWCFSTVYVLQSLLAFIYLLYFALISKEMIQRMYGFTISLSAILCLLMACGGRQEGWADRSNDQVHHDLKEIRKKRKIVVLAENSLSTFFIYKGKKMGFEYEMLQAFAKHIGVQLEVRVVQNKDDMIQMLKEGKGDVMACNLTVTNERKKQIAFSTPYMRSRQVLVQRKPKNWEKMSEEEINAKLVRSPSDLVGKKIYVWKHSSYYQRLLHLQEEIGDSLRIVALSGENGVEELIEQVSEGEISYTVVEDNIASLHQFFYPNIDVSTKISLEQSIAFGMRKTSPQLKKIMSQWIRSFKKSPEFGKLANHYFNLNRLSFNPDEFIKNSRKGQLSAYDEIFKQAAEKHELNWLFLAAIAFQESKFNPKARGLGGAFGLMQFMPSTGRKYGVNASSSAEKQVFAAARMIKKNDEYWKAIKDKSQREKFILASYNAGSNHIEDARRLARKYGLNAFIWDGNVEKMVRNLSKSKYYTDPVVRFGSMRGAHTCNYVRKIHGMYTDWLSIYHNQPDKKSKSIKHQKAS
jgi:membrane-bound lytic murein transglycosylase F